MNLPCEVLGPLISLVDIEKAPANNQLCILVLVYIFFASDPYYPRGNIKDAVDLGQAFLRVIEVEQL